MNKPFTPRKCILNFLRSKQWPVQVHYYSFVQSLTIFFLLLFLHNSRQFSDNQPAPSLTAAVQTYRDEFNNQTYTESNGTDNWSGNAWTEISEPTGAGPTSGPVQVSPNSTYCLSPNCLRVGGTQPGNPDPGFGVYRQLDLSGSNTATLSYSYRRGTFGSPVPTTGTMTLDISGNGGSSWTTLKTYNFDGTDAGQISESFDVSSYIAANTQIRFLTHGPVDDIVFFIDDIQVEHEAVLPESYYDEFQSIAYNGSDGTVDWTTNLWDEVGDGSDDHTTGAIAVRNSANAYGGSGNTLKTDLGHGNSAPGVYVYRELDLSSASSATLSFYLRHTLSGSDDIALEISNNGGVSWTVLKNYTSGNADPSNESFDISAYTAANTRIRFIIMTIGGAGSIWTDNIKVEYQTGSSGYDNPACNDVTNDEFDNGTTDWYIYFQSGNSGSWSVDNTGQLSGTNSAFVDLASVSGDNWGVEFRHEPLSITSGTQYAFRFDAKAAANRNITVVVQERQSPWTVYHTENIAITTIATQYGPYTFTAPVTEANAGLVFRLGETVEDVYIDDVIFGEESCFQATANAPVANDDIDNTNDNTAVTTDILSNDTDADGNLDATSVTIISSASNGSLSVNPVTGAVTYTPDTLFAGTDQYTYQVCDTDPTCDQATVTITVTDRTHIIGHVFDDKNANGLFDGADNGQSGVTVKLYEDNNQDGSVDAGDTQLSTQSTDANGFYDFLPAVGGTSQTITSRINSISDDAEENISNGSIDLTSSDLELISDAGTDQIVGMRFTNITVPQGATITNAYIEFEVDELDSGTTNLTFKGQDSDNAATFSSTAYDISNTTNRPRTSASIPWTDVGAWSTESEKKPTPDLSNIVQEIVNRGGWSSGNSMVIFVEGNGERTAESYTGEPANAPLLSITYTTASYPYYFVLDIDTGTLPGGATMTTDNVEAAVINAANEDDAGNNFGFSTNTPPVANDDTDSTPEDTPVVTDVTVNDTDSDGTIDPTTVAIVTAASMGTLSVNGVTGAVTYTPSQDSTGTDQYSYRVCDDDSACDTAIVIITITPVNDNPVAVNDAFSVTYNTPNQSLDVLYSGIDDYDIEGDTIRLNSAGTDAADGASTQGGTVLVNDNGTPLDYSDDFILYSPFSNYVGRDTFLYLISDGVGGSDTGAVYLAIYSSSELNCINGFDDDNDGLMDTDDPDCRPVTPVNILRY